MTKNQFRIRLIQQALLQKRGKALLIVLAVAMGASVVTALLNLEVDLRQRMNRELRDYGPNVLILPNPKFDRHSIDPEIATALGESNLSSQIIAFTPEMFTTVQIKDQTVMLTGADLKTLAKLHPSWQWKGALPDSGEIFAGRRLAEKLNIGKGSEVRLKINGVERAIQLSGTVEGGESEDDQLFMRLEKMRQLTGQRESQLIAISVLGDLPEVERTFAAFVRDHSGVTFQIVRKIAAAETQILDKISRLMSLVISIIFVILFFCIYTSVSAILISRQQEIALLRVLGARRKQIMGGLTLELLVLALAGALIGFISGILMAQVLGQVLFQTYVIPRVGVFLITIFSSLAIMVISSILPIQRAINRQAATVLKEA